METKEKAKRVVRAIKNGTFFTKVKQKTIKIFSSSYVKNIKIDENKITFITFQGRYECNPKAICEEIIKQKLPYKLVWIAKKDDFNNLEQYPKELKIVLHNSIESYKELASSKIIIMNATELINLNYKKRKGQIYIQTWHGSMGFKRLYTDNRSKWRKNAFKLGTQTEYIVTNSDFETKVYRETYWKDTPLLEYGHARNDILINKGKEYDEASLKVRKLYNIPKNKKIVLWAPTFRNDLTYKHYMLDYNKLKECLKNKYNCDFEILVRFHYKLMEQKVPKNFFDGVVNANEYPDIQDLLCASDVGITDYSSWMCDYVLTKKPGFLYTPDIDYYDKERGFYYPLETTPFGASKTQEELFERINNFDQNKYNKEVDKFLKDRGCFEKGNASVRIVEKIKELMK